MATDKDDSDEDDPAPALLRWLENGTSGSGEASVKILTSHFFEATVSSTVQVLSNTQVDLIAPHYTEKGTVRSCLAEGTNYIVTIRLNPEYRNPPLGAQRDPGVFALDNFLTEEQEERILQELEEELSGERKAAKALRLFQLA